MVHPSESNNTYSDKTGQCFHTFAMKVQEDQPNCHLVTLNALHMPHSPRSPFICAPQKIHVVNGKKNCNFMFDTTVLFSSQDQVICISAEAVKVKVVLINGHCNESCQGTQCGVFLFSTTVLTPCSETIQLTFDFLKVVWSLIPEEYILLPVHQVIPLCTTKLSLMQCNTNYQQLQGITVAWSSHSMDKLDSSLQTLTEIRQSSPLRIWNKHKNTLGITSTALNSHKAKSFACRNPQYYHQIYSCKINLIQNSQAVKKECGPEKGYGEKRCEIQGGGQEMAVMVG